METARAFHTEFHRLGVVSFRRRFRPTTTLITPAARSTGVVREFILPSIRDYESLLHFFHVPSVPPLGILPIGSSVITSHPRFSFRHGAELATIYPERPIFFRGSKMESNEKPYFREHTPHRRLPIIGKPSRWISPQLLSNNLSLMKC